MFRDSSSVDLIDAHAAGHFLKKASDCGVGAASKLLVSGTGRASPTSCDQVAKLASSPVRFEAWLLGCFDGFVMHETLILRVGLADVLLQILKLRFLRQITLIVCGVWQLACVPASVRHAKYYLK